VKEYELLLEEPGLLKVISVHVTLTFKLHFTQTFDSIIKNTAEIHCCKNNLRQIIWKHTIS
jgi:hypothetical protein